MNALRIILLPISFLYGLAMQFRNTLFDLKILREARFDRAVIGTGNLSYGGTGKTPMIEYLIRLLSASVNIATLSRGYGRESRGFVIASGQSDAKELGDEPLQFARKFGHVKVAVDEKRVRGVGMLLQEHPAIDVILLDDAFQHRYVKPGISILLTDYHRLYTEDAVLPSGTLREFRSGAARADIIVVTKTPKIFSPITRRRILEAIKPRKHQKVFFSYLRYGQLTPVYESAPELPQKLINILLFTGIANDDPLREHLERACSELFTVKYSDHHTYTPKDIQDILKKFADLPTYKKILVTTEKDVMRIKVPEFDTILAHVPLFYLPVEVDFHAGDKEKFDNEILSYVKKNKRDH